MGKGRSLQGEDFTGATAFPPGLTLSLTGRIQAGGVLGCRGVRVTLCLCFLQTPTRPILARRLEPALAELSQQLQS